MDSNVSTPAVESEYSSPLKNSLSLQSVSKRVYSGNRVLLNTMHDLSNFVTHNPVSYLLCRRSG